MKRILLLLLIPALAFGQLYRPGSRSVGGIISGSGLSRAGRFTSNWSIAMKTLVFLLMFSVPAFGQLYRSGGAPDTLNMSRGALIGGYAGIGGGAADYPLTVYGGIAGGGATGVTTAGFINNTDTDQWIKLQSGLTGNYRSYLAWYGYAGGSDYQWLMGRNAGLGGNAVGNFILYDKSGGAGHRFYFIANGSGMANAGRTNIMSNGTESVVINGANWDNQQGTGGMKVYGGGAGTAPLWTTIDSNGVNVSKGKLEVRPLYEGPGYVNIYGGTDSVNTAYVAFYDRNTPTAKWFIGKHNTANDFRIYNYTVPGYALHISSATNKIGIGNTAPDSTLHLTGSLHTTGNVRIDGTVRAVGLAFYANRAAAKAAGLTVGAFFLSGADSTVVSCVDK